MPIERYDIVEITVKGEASGQAIDNVFHYRAEDFVGARDLDSFLSNFRLDWEGPICDLLTTEYSVLSYEARILGGMIWLTEAVPPSLPSRPAIRYKESVQQDGDVDSVGTDAPPAHPTQTAVSIRKKCGPLYTWAVDVAQDEEPVLKALEKMVDGGCRLSSIAEDLSEAADQNRWTAAYVTAVGAAFDSIRVVSTGAAAQNMTMCVLSPVANKVQRTLPASGLPTLYVAEVTSFSVNPYVSSQNSRKQSRAG